MTLSVRTDRDLIRTSGGSERFLLVRYTAPRARVRVRPPLDVSFVLDRSGSMGGEKIRLARQAVLSAIARLDAGDRFSVVAYDDAVDVVVESTAASPEARRNAARTLEGIGARGSTDLGAGWLTGCEQVARHVHREALPLVLLLTDGLANQGITDRDALHRHAANVRADPERARPYAAGADFDEALLAGMADAGGGRFTFIPDAAGIEPAIGREIGDALEVVVRDAVLELIAPPAVEVEALTRYETRRAEDRWVVELRDLVSEQEVEAVLRVRFPAGEETQEQPVIVRVADPAGAIDERHVEVRWRYAGHHANDTQPRDREGEALSPRLFAARAREEALGHQRRGDTRAAEAALVSVARRIRSCAGADPSLLAVAEDLEARQVRYAAPMSPMAVKAEHMAATSAARGLSESGDRRRGRA